MSRAADGAGARSRSRGDAASVAIVVLIGIVALPWIFSNAGFYIGDVPGLQHVYMSKQILPEAGHPHLRAVHLGNHEGLDGWLLVATALGLRGALPRMRPTRLRTVLSGYLALLFGYGLMVAANDAWNEQLVKRGWTSLRIPSVLTPSLTAGWVFLVAATVLVYLTAFRVSPPRAHHPALSRATLGRWRR